MNDIGWRLLALPGLRLLTWRLLARRCDRIMRTEHGQPGCASPREHRERGL
jgi:hypothetical protein